MMAFAPRFFTTTTMVGRSKLFATFDRRYGKHRGSLDFTDLLANPFWSSADRPVEMLLAICIVNPVMM